MKTVSEGIVDVCQRLNDKGLVANHDGNVTVRLPDGLILSTPTSFAKKDVTADDLLTLDSSGKVISGKHKVFSEIAWHLAIYRVRPDIKCIVHGHPPVASGFGLARREIGVPGVPEAIVSLGREILNLPFFSPLAPEIRQPGSSFDKALSRVLRESDGFVAEGNGVWAVGNDPLHAYLRLELIEHIAKQHMAAWSLGRVFAVDDLTIGELMKKRPSQPSEKAGPHSIDRELIKEAVRRELSGFNRH